MNKIKLAAVTLTAAALLVPLSATPAQAAYAVITVCNATYSDGEILAFNSSIGYRLTLYPGQCGDKVRDDYGNARVDVDPPGGWIDVDSWTKRRIGDPWTSLCYESENHASDPFSGSGAGTTYWVFQYNGCTNA